MKMCVLTSAAEHSLELEDLGLNSLSFWRFARKLIFLGRPRLKIKRFVRGILIDSSAAFRRNLPKSFMDRCGVVSH